MKTSELSGALLDYWVARAELEEFKGCKLDRNVQSRIDEKLSHAGQPFRPSLNWAQGGPIIERERISVVIDKDDNEWQAAMNVCDQNMMGFGGNHYQYGPTPLVAAMRAYVASKYGDSVPDEGGVS
ncbi:hypothetical protein y223_00034 [Bordetella phage PY223]